MKNENGFRKAAVIVPTGQQLGASLHPAWRTFIHYCREMQHGEIEVLKIQDGLPVIAEVTKKKVKFAP